MKTVEVDIAVPDGVQLIIGQSHFIKSVEDLYEALATSMPGIRFGLAFCEASGSALIRLEGNDATLTDLARDFAARVAAGHSFVIVLKEAYPINVLNRVKAVDEVVNIFCATSNPVKVIVAESESGRGILGVIDGVIPEGVERDADREERKALLRKIGYKR